jgi:hypothetical protein
MGERLKVRTMADIKSKKLLYAKGIFFVIIGLLASALILIEHPSIWIAILLVLAVWAFCRAYYFAFYVIEHYIDPGHKFAGLTSFVRYVFTRRRSDGARPREIDQ